MQIAEYRRLGPAFERRLKAALDSVAPRTPLVANARYRSLTLVRPRRALRLAPALVGIGAIVVTALSAAAATGSTDPVVWTKRAASTIQSVSHVPDASPNLPQNTGPDRRGTAPVPQQAATSHDNPTSGRRSEPTNKPQPTEKPEESPRPDQSPPPDHSESPPSPKPPDSPGQDSNSKPPPPDHGGDPHGH